MSSGHLVEMPVMFSGKNTIKYTPETLILDLSWDVESSARSSVALGTIILNNSGLGEELDGDIPLSVRRSHKADADAHIYNSPSPSDRINISSRIPVHS